MSGGRRSGGRRMVGAFLAVGLTVGTAALSRVSVEFSHPDQALLRLSWRVEGVALEECRERTPEELERLPVHMRNARACIGTIAPYTLHVTVDGRTVVTDTVVAPGARGDRPIPVFAEVPLRPGTYEVEVRFDAILPEGAEPPGNLPDLDWDGNVTVGGREIALLTLAEDRSGLVLRTPRG